MAQRPWVTNAFKPLDMFAIQGYPHTMPQKFDKWLPKFSGNNVITVEEHIDNFYACFQIHPLNNDDEDVVMKLFVASLVEDARKWYNNLLDKSIKTWEAFHDTFMKRWDTKRDSRLLLVQFNEMKKENESIK
jgi:hypothetical protein